MKLRRFRTYTTALARWTRAGNPVRSDAEVSRLLAICEQCDRYHEATCHHPDCGCAVQGPADRTTLLGRTLGPAFANKLRMGTESCPLSRWGTAAPRWVSNADRAYATLQLAAMLPANVTAVAGVSRSGLSSAMQIAELLHLHPFAVSLRGDLQSLPHGARFEQRRPDTGLLVVVDDTVASGQSLEVLRRHADRLVRPAIYAVTYASPQAAHLVDLYAESLSLPHYLEWNFFNSVYLPSTALDLDGVLCRDCRPEEDDDGPAYARFLATAEPLYLPRRDPVPLIVTARLEKYRPETEAWLARWGVRYQRLVMGPWTTLSQRRKEYSAAGYKGRVFAASGLSIFVESCPIQSREIAAVLPGRTVICPATGEVYV